MAWQKTRFFFVEPGAEQGGEDAWMWDSAETDLGSDKTLDILMALN